MRDKPKVDRSVASERLGAPRSPCVEICVLDEFDVCRGCYRAADEIIEWFSASDERKLEILFAAADRRQTG